MYNTAIKDNSELVICDMIDHHEDGTKIKLNCTKFDSIYKVTPSACNKIFRKTMIEDLTFLNDKWYEDLNYTTKVLLKNPRISVISEAYYNCHVRNSSIIFP